MSKDWSQLVLSDHNEIKAYINKEVRQGTS